MFGSKVKKYVVKKTELEKVWGPHTHTHTHNKTYRQTYAIHTDRHTPYIHTDIHHTYTQTYTSTYLPPLLVLWGVIFQSNQSRPYHVEPVDVQNVICSTAHVPKYASG